MDTIPEHTYLVGWIETIDGTHRSIRKRGIQDVAEFVRNCEAYGRELTSVRIDE